MPGLALGIHPPSVGVWMAGSSPAMTLARHMRPYNPPIWRGLESLQVRIFKEGDLCCGINPATHQELFRTACFCLGRASLGPSRAPSVVTIDAERELASRARLYLRD
jgi:hypothetical protein